MEEIDELIDQRLLKVDVNLENLKDIFGYFYSEISRQGKEIGFLNQKIAELSKPDVFNSLSQKIDSFSSIFDKRLSNMEFHFKETVTSLKESDNANKKLIDSNYITLQHTIGAEVASIELKLEGYDQIRFKLQSIQDQVQKYVSNEGNSVLETKCIDLKEELGQMITRNQKYEESENKKQRALLKRVQALEVRLANMNIKKPEKRESSPGSDSTRGMIRSPSLPETPTIEKTGIATSASATVIPSPDFTKNLLVTRSISNNVTPKIPSITFTIPESPVESSHSSQRDTVVSQVVPQEISKPKVPLIDSLPISKDIKAKDSSSRSKDSMSFSMVITSQSPHKKNSEKSNDLKGIKEILLKHTQDIKEIEKQIKSIMSSQNAAFNTFNEQEKYLQTVSSNINRYINDFGLRISLIETSIKDPPRSAHQESLILDGTSIGRQKMVCLACGQPRNLVSPITELTMNEILSPRHQDEKPGAKITLLIPEEKRPKTSLTSRSFSKQKK